MPEKKVLTVEDFVQQGGTVVPEGVTPEITTPANVGSAPLSGSIAAGEYKGRVSSASFRDLGYDLEHFQARQQTTGEKWSNGIAKFTEQVGTGVVGNVANLFYGTGSAIVNGSFNKFFDNDFTQTLDSWDDATREKFQNFSTNQERDRAWYKNMGTANFWADDFLGGMAFTVSAVLSEITMTAATAATFGATGALQAGMTARLMAKAARGINSLNKANKAKTGVSAISSARSAINAANKIDKTALFTRRLITGAGYEAGVEARGFKDEAWAERLKGLEGVDSKEQLKKSNPELYNTLESSINSAANFVFAGNTALVGLSNFVTLPKTFGKGLFKSGSINSSILSPTRVSGREGAYNLAYNNWNKLQKTSHFSKELIKRPLTEGLFEEGGQGFVKRTGLEYISKSYSPEGVATSYDVVSAMNDAFDKTYGSSFDNEFWKEVGIGMIIGSLGSPTFNFKSGAKGMWQGSLVGAVTDTNDKIAEAEKLVELANADPGMSKLALMQKQANLVHETNKEMHEAHNKKDFYRGKNAESQEFYNMVANRYKLGVSDQMLGDTVEEVENMPIEEFAETFGYEGNMTQEELYARKKEVIETATDNTNRAVEAIRQAEKTIQDYSFVTDAGTLNSSELIEAVAYNDYMVSDLDKREVELADSISKDLNIDARTLLDIRNENNSVRWTKKAIDRFRGHKKELEESEEELKDAESIDASQSEIEVLRKKVNKQKSRYYRALKKEHTKRKNTTNKGKKYDRDFESFKELVESTTALQDQVNNLYVDKPTRAKSTENKLNDLTKMASQREAYVEDMSTLLSIEGFKAFTEELDKVREASIKDSRINLYNKLKEIVQSSETLTEEQIQQITEKIEEQANLDNKDVSKPNTLTTKSENKLIKTIIDNLNTYNETSKTLAQFNNFKVYLTNSKNSLKDKIKNEDDGTVAFEEIKAEYEELLDTIYKLENYVQSSISSLINKSKEKSYNGFTSVLNSVKSFVRFFNKDENGKDINVEEVLQGRSWDEIKKVLQFSVEEWEDAPVEDSPSKNKDGSLMDTDVKVSSSYLHTDGKRYALRIKIGGVLIGALSVPNKFTIDGRPLDFSDLNDIKKLNKDFTPEELKQLNFYKHNYEALVTEALSGTYIGYEALKDVVDFKLYLKQLEYIPKGEGRTSVKDSVDSQVNLGNKKGHLLYNRNGYSVSSEDEEGNVRKTKGAYLFLHEGNKYVLSRQSNPAMYQEAKRIMMEGGAKFTSKLYHSDFLLVPRGNKKDGSSNYGLIGLDYPAENDATIDDETLNTTFAENIEKFSNWSDKQNNENTDKNSKKSIYNMPLTITLVRENSNTKVNLDISVPLLRTKNEDGTWSKKVTLYGNAKGTGSTSLHHSLFLGLSYNEDFSNIQIVTDSKKGEKVDLTVANLKEQINTRLKWSITQKDKRTGTVNVANIITENGTVPSGNVSVANIYPQDVNTAKENLELAARPTDAAIVTEPSSRMTEDIPENFNPTSKDPVTPAPEENSPANPAPQPTNLEPDLNEYGSDLNKTTWEHVPNSLSAGLKLFIKLLGGTEQHEMLLAGDIQSLGPKYLEALTTIAKREFGHDSYNMSQFFNDLQIVEDSINNKENEDDPDSDDLAFSTKKLEGEAVNIAQAKKILSKILPSSIKIKSLDTVLKNLQANGEVFGVFMNNIIYLDSNKATKGTAYHEAFHAVFRTIFTKEEKEQMLILAQKEFGDPTSKDLNELKQVTSRYDKYSKKELTELWLEEKLADKFAEYKPTKLSWLQKLINKIKSWLGFVTDSSLSKVFDAIYEGKLKDRTSTSIVSGEPVFSMLKTSGNNTLTPRNSEIIFSRVHQRYLNNTSEESYKVKITKAIEEVKEELNWINNPRIATAKSKKMYNSLRGQGLQLNEKLIRDEISSRIGNYNFNVNTKEVEEENTDNDDETPERDFNPDLGKYAGISSLSKRIRTYLTTVHQSEDYLGLNLTEEELKDDMWKVSVNHDRVYDALVRGLADVAEKDILPRIYFMGQSNPSIKTFFDKVIIDIHKEAGIEEDFDIKNSLNYDRSTLYRELVSNFDKTKVNFQSMIYDPKSKTYRIFNSNRKNIARDQVSKWNANFNIARNSVDPNQASDFIEKEVMEVYGPNATKNEGIGTWVANLDNNAKFVRDSLEEKIGLKLHIDYVKWSMIKDSLISENTVEINGEMLENSITGLIEHYKNIGNTNLAVLEDLVQFYETFESAGNSLDQEVDGVRLLSDRLLSILRDDKANHNPFALQSDDIDEDVARQGAGAVTRFKFIASANSIFDSTLSETTFRNNEGNNISDKVSNSFYTDMFRILKTPKFKFLLKDIKEGVASWEDLKSVLEDNQIFYTDDFIKLYMEAISNNPLLTENLDDIFNANKETEILGGIREATFTEDGSVNTQSDFKNGKDFKNMTPIERMLFNMYNYENSFFTKNKKTYSKFSLEVNEDKNTSYIFSLPVKEYLFKGKPNAVFLKDYFKLFQTEFNIIKNDTLVDKINKFNVGEESDRKNKFFKFNFLSDDLKKALLNSDTITEELEKEVKKQLAADATKKINNYVNVLKKEQATDSLPESFASQSGVDSNKQPIYNVNREEVGKFVLNTFINSHSLSDLMNGSDMVGHNSILDIIKRNGGKVAYGQSLGSGHTNIATIKDYSIPGINYSKDENGKEKGLIDEAGDGQTWSTPGWRINTYLRGIGKFRNELERSYTKDGIGLLDKARLGIELNLKELNVMKKHNALFNSLKIVGRDAQSYLKTSISTISRADVSKLAFKDRQEAVNLLRDIKEIEISGENEEILDYLFTQLHALYKPLPHRIEMHNMLNDMELNNVHLVTYESAMKTAIINSADYAKGEKLSPIKMSNRILREQVNTDGFKEEIVDGTQLLNIIWSEQSDEKQALVSKYKSYLAERSKEGFDILKGTIFEDMPNKKDIVPRYKELYKEFKANIASSLEDPYMAQLFELDPKGQPLYDNNFTAVVSKFESMFLSYVSKHSFKFKSAGRKYTLTANAGYRVKVDKNDNVIPTDSNNTHSSVRRLKYDKKTGIAEVIVSKYAFKDHLEEIKENNGFIPEYLAMQLGFRIPTQDNSSIVKLKIVDMIDGAYGSTIIIPSEINEISGSDFDVDSLFAKLFNFTNKGKFGDYKNIKSEELAMQAAMTEITESKLVKSKVREAVRNISEDFRHLMNIQSNTLEVDEFDEYIKEMALKNGKIEAAIDSVYADLGILTIPMFKESDYFDKFIAVRKGDNYGTSLTREELDNNILEAQMELAFNDHATETSEREPILETYKFLEEQGITLKDNVSGAHDPASQYQAHKANYAGSGGIGPMALFNIAFQYMRANDSKFTTKVKEIEDVDGIDVIKVVEKPLEVYPGFSSFNTDMAGKHRVNKLISAFITAFTDNAKHLDSEKLGINKNLITHIATVFSSGVPLNEAVPFFLQDSIQIWKDIKANKSYITDEDIKKGLMEKAKANGFSKSDLEIAFGSKIKYKVNKENILANLKFQEDNYARVEDSIEINKRFISPELKRWVDINLQSYEYFKNTDKIANEIFHFTRVLSLVKGVKKSTANVQSILDSTKKLGVGFNSGYKVVSNLDKVMTATNWFSIINKNKNIERSLLNLKELDRDILKEFLISHSIGGKDLLESLIINNKSNRFTKEDDFKTVLGEFSSFIQLKAYMHKGKNKIKYDFNDDIFNREFYDTLNDLKAEAKAGDTILQENKLLQQLRQRNYKFKDKSDFAGLLLTWGEMNTNTKKDADDTTELLDGFSELHESSNPKAKKLAKLIFKQVAIKDNFKFKSNSLIRLISLRYLKPNLIDLLPEIKEALNSGTPAKYDALFGMDLGQLRDDFIKSYSRNTVNYKNVRTLNNNQLKSLLGATNEEGYVRSGFDADNLPTYQTVNDPFNNNLVSYYKGKDGIERLYFNSEINKKIGKNMESLAKSKLFDLDMNWETGYNRLTFPRVIRVAQEYYQLEGFTREKINKGSKASYVKVNRIGNYLMSPYAFTIDQWDELKESQADKSTTVEVDEIPVPKEKEVKVLPTPVEKVPTTKSEDEEQKSSVQDQRYTDQILSPKGVEAYKNQGLTGEEIEKHIKKYLTDNMETFTLDGAQDYLDTIVTEKIYGGKRLPSYKLNLNYKVTSERIEDIKSLKTLTDKLLTKFNGLVKNVVFDDTIQGKGEYDSKTKTVYINTKQVTKDTPFHEFAHPLIIAIRQDNPKLYTALYKSLENSEQGQDLIKKINSAYKNYSQVQLKDEAIVTALGINTATLEDKTLVSYLDRFWQKLRQYIMKLLNNPSMEIVVSDLDNETTLKDLATLMISDNKISKNLIKSELNNTYSQKTAVNKVKSINNKLGRTAVVVARTYEGAYEIKPLVSENITKIIKELEECQ